MRQKGCFAQRGGRSEGCVDTKGVLCLATLPQKKEGYGRGKGRKMKIESPTPEENQEKGRAEGERKYRGMGVAHLGGMSDAWAWVFGGKTLKAYTKLQERGN